MNNSQIHLFHTFEKKNPGILVLNLVCGPIHACKYNANFLPTNKIEHLSVSLAVYILIYLFTNYYFF